MTTTWRTTIEGFKQTENPSIENFASIPIFEVLYNNKITEGMNTCAPFNMFCNDYFQNVGRLKGISGIKDIIDKIVNKLKTIIGKITNPLRSMDELFDESIMNILKIYVNLALEDCSKKSPVTTENPINLPDMFTWIEQFTNMQEGFNIGPMDVSGTILNLQTNHPNIHPIKLSNYYIRKLNKRYRDLNGNATQDDLFEFNNDMDMNQLTNPKIIEKIQDSSIQIPVPLPMSFEEYMEKYARFSFSTDTTISYYSYLNTYFSLPGSSISGIGSSPLESFENILKDDFINNTNNATEKYKTGNKNAVISIPTVADSPNSNYIFSIDLNSIKTDTIPNYLKTMILYLSFVFINNKKVSDATFIDIIPKIATVYVNIINYVEYYKYLQLNQYLTSEEIAVFNHIFYCSLNQTDIESNLFDGKNNYSLPTQYFNEDNNIIPYIITCLTNIVDRMQVVFSDTNIWYSADLIEEYPITNLMQMHTTSDKMVFVQFINNIIPSNEILEYYNTDNDTYIALQSCKSRNDAIFKQFKQYSYTIKQELYRMFMIPIILFIVYNFYYMFIFKDCFGYAKSAENDQYIFEKTCKNGCFYPQFPDWELNFHNMENHRTDYIFEFIFKPVKCIYVFLNAVKRIFCNNGILSFFPSNYPYLCFFAIFFIIYNIINKYGWKLLNIIKSLFKLDIPNISIGSLNITNTASIIVWLFFAKSFLKGIGVIKNFESTDDDDDKDKTQTWIEWIQDTKGSGIIMIIKAICFIVFWVLRAAIVSFTIPLSIMIIFIYLVWVSLAGILDYTDKSHSYSDKFELINRILYSKMFELPKYEFGKNTMKTASFYLFYFLTEFIILFTLKKGIIK